MDIYIHVCRYYLWGRTTPLISHCIQTTTFCVHLNGSSKSFLRKPSLSLGEPSDTALVYCMLPYDNSPAPLLARLVLEDQRVAFELSPLDIHWHYQLPLIPCTGEAAGRSFLEWHGVEEAVVTPEKECNNKVNVKSRSGTETTKNPKESWANAWSRDDRVMH